MFSVCLEALDFKAEHIFLLFVLVGISSVATAKEWEDNPHLRDRNPNVEEYVWKEERVVIPPYPKEGDLQEFPVDQPQNRFTYYVDRASLTVGKDDIVRYTVVVRSRSGAENVMHEGVRCQTKEYKGYAFGNGRGAYRKARKPMWRIISKRKHNFFRHTLVTDYLCNVKIGDHTTENILQHMRYHHRRIREDRI